MNKILLICCLSLFTVKVFGQQFSQYNTGTLYDSFENPSQRSFIPDSSRQMAFNFFIPNLTANFSVQGNGQYAVLSRLVSSYYNTGALQIGKGRYNTIIANANAYSVMFKLFTNLEGSQEIGFFVNTKGESRGWVSDESLALFNGARNFPEDIYNNIFNDNYFYQLYHQVGFTYREQVTPQFALGIKLSALSGVTYRDGNITESSIVFDKPNDRATLSMLGTSRSSGGVVSGLRFSNPGASISIGTTYTNADSYRFQYNLKDLGFIYWGNNSISSNFANSALITGLSTVDREKNIFDKLADVTTGSMTTNGFYTKTNALAEISANKNYWLDYDRRFKFSPTLIASKELFYSGFTGALVAPLQYQNYTITFTNSYNTIGLYKFGGQAMIKSANAEFYIGTETLLQTGRTTLLALRNNRAQTRYIPNSFSGTDFFIGASFKFGSVIEHPMNASWIPTGDDKGFIGRLYDRIFKKDKGY